MPVNRELYVLADFIRSKDGAILTFNPTGGAALVSNPPQGKYKVLNLFVNELGKLIVEYDNTPTP